MGVFVLIWIKRRGISVNLKLFYIYNPEQADFFIKNGATVLGAGKGKFNDVYVKFARTKKEEEIFNKWAEICKKARSG